MNTPCTRTSRSYGTPLLLLAAGLLAGTVLTACDTTVDLPEEPARAFTMWGALNPRQDTQTVKVFPLGAGLDDVSAEELPATVTSTNLETGRVRTWRDSLVREKAGDRAHVYWAPFSPKYGHSFRIEATSEQQGSASATAAVPPRIDLEVVSILPSGGIGRIKVRVPPSAPEILPRARLYYTVKIGDERPYADDPIETEDVIVTQVLSAPIQQRQDGWLIETRLHTDAREIDNRVNVIRDTLGIPLSDGPGCCKLDLIDLTVEVQIVDRTWSFPDNSLDRTSVTQPGVLSNVENGFGLVGAGYDQWVEVEVPEELGEEAGFRRSFCTKGCEIPPGPDYPRGPRP